MDAWPPSRGEALHTQTFLGHPPGCAAALASLAVIEEEKLVERARGDAARARSRTCARASRVAAASPTCAASGCCSRSSATRPERAARACAEALRRGVIVAAVGRRRPRALDHAAALDRAGRARAARSTLLAEALA